MVDNYLIDEINIKQANKEAMRRALVELLRKIEQPLPNPPLTGEGIKSKQDYIKGVFVDGNDNYTFDELDKKPIFVIG